MERDKSSNAAEILSVAPIPLDAWYAVEFDPLRSDPAVELLHRSDFVNK